jgi:hypothetical protein
LYFIFFQQQFFISAKLMFSFWSEWTVKDYSLVAFYMLVSLSSTIVYCHFSSTNIWLLDKLEQLLGIQFRCFVLSIQAIFPAQVSVKQKQIISAVLIILILQLVWLSESSLFNAITLAGWLPLPLEYTLPVLLLLRSMKIWQKLIFYSCIGIVIGAQTSTLLRFA